MARPDKTLIQERFKESIDAWIVDGRPTGQFLEAVLSNNLQESIGRGDNEAIDNLPHIVAYLYNSCPETCWGSPAKVKAWADEKARNWHIRRDERNGRHTP